MVHIRADGDKPLLHEALRLRSMGISVLPIGRDKKPAIRKWQHLQQRIASEIEIRKWFSRASVTGLGIVLGAVSGHLVVRDFDEEEAFEAWKAAYPQLAATLPIVKTHRGVHVYARMPDVATTKLGDGELRGGGAYVVAPPSRHPKGSIYRWNRELCSPDSIQPLSIDESGFRETWSDNSAFDHATEMSERTEDNRGRQKRTEHNRGNLKRTDDNRGHISGEVSISKLSDDELSRIRAAINSTLPSEPGNRNNCIFEFARRLKALTEFADADPTQLFELVRLWHQTALPNIWTKDFDDTRIDFVNAWRKVKYPYGTGPLHDAISRLNDNDLPPIAGRYADLKKRRMVGLCRELQRSNPTGTFFLSCRTAGDCLKVDPTTANRWLSLLCMDGILQLITPGNQNRAARYRYLPKD